eukprot:scaffold818_cov64-Phaeocystis_antarctica.AAC.1
MGVGRVHAPLPPPLRGRGGCGWRRVHLRRPFPRRLIGALVVVICAAIRAAHLLPVGDDGCRGRGEAAAAEGGGLGCPRRPYPKACRPHPKASHRLRQPGRQPGRMMLLAGRRGRGHRLVELRRPLPGGLVRLDVVVVRAPVRTYHRLPSQGLLRGATVAGGRHAHVQRLDVPRAAVVTLDRAEACRRLRRDHRDVATIQVRLRALEALQAHAHPPAHLAEAHPDALPGVAARSGHLGGPTALLPRLARDDVLHAVRRPHRGANRRVNLPSARSLAGASQRTRAWIYLHALFTFVILHVAQRVGQPLPEPRFARPCAEGVPAAPLLLHRQI